MKEDRHPDLDIIARCAEGDRGAQRLVMDRLLPVVRMQVSLLLRHMAGSRDSRADKQDLVQDVLVELLRKKAQELRRWQPSGGLTFEGFVRLITRRFVARRICHQGRRVERFLATAPDALDMVTSPQHEDLVARRDEIETVMRELHARMSERDQVLFTRVFVEGQTSAAVALELGMSTDALKKWRSRMYARVHQIATQLGPQAPAGDSMAPPPLRDPKPSSVPKPTSVPVLMTTKDATARKARP